jgi:histidinol-phosphate phosphatase family protein
MIHFSRIKFRINEENLFKGLVLLDADGVLWDDGLDLLTSKNFKIPLNSVATLRQLKSLGYKIAIISNQTKFAKKQIGFFGFVFYTYRNARKLLSENLVDGIYLCIHHPKSSRIITRKNCKCRKPSPSMLTKAIKDLAPANKIVWFVGDRITDMYAAFNAGITSMVLIFNERLLENNISQYSLENNSGIVSFKLALKFSEIPHYLSIKNSDSDIALILAAGQGTRLLPLTEETPKVLLNLGKTTILDRLINQLQSFDQDLNIFINISHKAKLILRWLSESEHNLSRIVFLYERNRLGTARTIYELLKQIEKRILVLHGDLVLVDMGVRELLQVYKNSTGNVVYYHLKNRIESRSEIITEGKNVVDFIEKSSLNVKMKDSTGKEEIKVNSGIYIFLPNIYSNLEPPKLGSDIPEFLLTSLAKYRQLSALEWKGERFSVDSHDLLLAAQSYLSNPTS